ncbi:NAD(P)/FAD-dependent oxidoreductase [Clostridium grantii]|uniref:Pyridine nucleotide-disulphide oxidoreductase n=1 Tax=Clostridium grantii DSM 8605 TaxID=1121316 RepID=A0A1M5WU70_9CLOT|nr:FAD-dependent oxidoreductase [Clostridium grantii]SHH91031.1 Pyridine nucleotide-disulphide oxidoreductase [Clostridium grantii DSM 8605]
MNNQYNYIIIGAGAAGFNAAKAIRSKDKTSSILMVSKEDRLPYFRPQVSKSIVHEVPAKRFYLTNEQWFLDNQIHIELNTTVEEINTDNSYIVIKGIGSLKFDKLIIAAGANNFIPPTEGIEKEGVFSLRTIQDAENLKFYMKNSKKAVVIGAGLLGLEAAWELKQLGLDVKVVELAPCVLQRQLDLEGSNITKDLLKASGIEFILGDACCEILGKEKVEGIKLKSDRVLDTDILLYSIGIRPDIELIKQTSIEINRGIVVNDKMETNIPNIYACGDIAEFKKCILGTWPSAIEMGKVAGLNVVGEESKFETFVTSTLFNAMNVKIFSCGDLNDEYKTYTLDNLDENNFGKLFFKDNILVGAYLIGNISKSTKIVTCIKNSLSYDDVLAKIL